MPAPIDRGGEGFLFDRAAVLVALGITSAAHDVPAELAERPPVTRAEFEAALARTNRRNRGAAWRDRLADEKASAVAVRIVPIEAPNRHRRMTTREVCELARLSSATLWRRIDAGHMPGPIDQGGAGFLFDRVAVIRALGLEGVPAAELHAVARNTNDGQNMSDHVRARRQRAVDQSPGMTDRRRAELHQWMEELKAERLAKKNRKL